MKKIVFLLIITFVVIVSLLITKKEIITTIKKKFENNEKEKRTIDSLLTASWDWEDNLKTKRKVEKLYYQAKKIDFFDGQLEALRRILYIFFINPEIKNQEDTSKINSDTLVIRKALEIEKFAEQEYYRASFYNSLASIYKDLEKTKSKSIIYTLKAIDILKQKKVLSKRDSVLLIKIYSKISQSYSQLNYEKSRYFILQAHKLAILVDSVPVGLRKLLYNLFSSLLYPSISNTSDFNFYFRKYFEISNDSFFYAWV